MSCERHTVSPCHTCDCVTPIIIQVPGLQGTGILWENCTPAEKQEITQMLYDPIKEQTDKSVQIATESAEAAKKSEEKTAEYAETTKKLEEKTAEYAEVIAIIKPYTEDLSKVAKHVDDCIHPVSENINKVQDVANNLSTISRSAGLVEHTADIAALSSHLDDLHKVGQDLLATDVTDTSFDYGSVSDTVESVSTVTGGILKEVADHIEDCIHPVGEHIADIQGVQSNIEEIKTTNLHLDEIHLVGQDLQGIDSSSLDFGLVNDAVDPFTTVTGGYIKTVGGISTEVKAVADVKDSVVALAGMADNLEPLLAAAETITEVTQVDYKTIFLNGLS